MSDPNPFSNSNAPQHNLVSKIVKSSLLGSPYQVAVDLVDIHTAYTLQLGSPDEPVIQEYVQRIGTSEHRVQSIYADNIYGNINGTGVTGGTGINVNNNGSNSVVSANFIAGTGISFNIQNKAITVQNTLNFTAGSGISISSPTAPDFFYPFGTRVISFTGSTGSTANPQVAGNPGEIPFIGLTGNALVVDSSLQYDVTVPDPILYVPTMASRSVGNSGVIKFSTDVVGDSTIETGFEDYPGMGNILSIQSVGSTAATVTIDTIESFMGVNKTPTVELDVVGQTVLSYTVGTTGVTTTAYQAITGGSGPTGTLTLAPGTYKAYAWGQGGAGNGGAGGGGGYAEYNFTVAGTTSFSWTAAYGGASGGGNALVASIGSTQKFIVPGGGAGVTGATGGGGGNNTIGGLPTPEGGFVGGSTASFAEYTDLRDYLYTTTGGTINGSVANNDAYTNGLTGYIPQGMTMSLSRTALFEYNQTTNGVTYHIAPGTTITIETAGISFTNADLNIPTGALIPSGNITGLTVNDIGLSQGGTGGASYNNWVNSGASGGVSFVNAFADTGQSGITYSSGTVVMSQGSYNFVTGSTFTVFFQGSVSETMANQILVIGPGTTMIASAPLGGTNMIGLTFTSTGSAVLPNGSNINVSQRYFRNTNPIQPGFTGGAYGGGGLIGGGTPSLVVGVTGMTSGTTGNQPAGGGGGQYLDGVGVTLIHKVPGQGPLAFRNNLNRVGYGDGATGSGTPGSQYLVLQQQIINPTLGPALTVNGDSVLNGTCILGGSSGSVIVRSYGTPFQNTGPTEIVTHDIGFKSDNTSIVNDSFRLSAVLGSGAFGGDGLGFIISTATAPNNWTPTERFRITRGTSNTVGGNGITYPAGSVIVGGISGPSTSNLYVNGGAVIDSNSNSTNAVLTLRTGQPPQGVNSETSFVFIKGGSVGGGGVNANTLHLYRYGGDPYSWGSPGFAGSNVLEISAISAGSGVTGGGINNFTLNANTTLNGNVSIGTGYTFGPSGISGSGAPSRLTVTGSGSFGAGLTVGGGVAGAGLNVSNGITVSTSGTGPALTVNGTAIATDFTIPSDSRLKENVVTVDSALDKIMKMRGVYFNKLDETTRRIGVIAQEVEQILPEVVHTDDSPEQMKAVSYANIVGLLIEAIKEQQEMIKKLIQ
uniref:Peptidase S74 domain-containing protein n=1 Tax=viral metagenome TaxID=1070528 RepID=A0A6C0JJ56_9ZZZZ